MTTGAEVRNIMDASDVKTKAAKPKPLTLEQQIDKVAGAVVAVRAAHETRLGVLEQAWDEVFADFQKPVPRGVQMFSYVIACATVGTWIVQGIQLAWQVVQ